jgi:hypothetical protein
VCKGEREEEETFETKQQILSLIITAVTFHNPNIKQGLTVLETYVSEPAMEKCYVPCLAEDRSQSDS